MKLCRFESAGQPPRLGLTLDDTTVLDLSVAGLESVEAVLELPDPLRQLESLAEDTMSAYRLGALKLLPPIGRQPVWAAGVTYLRSRTARMEESTFAASAYDRVYEAARPELFFKALPENVVGPGAAVGIRRDSKWSVPEPELALVLNSRGQTVGYTIGNDMSARDLEGENLLYLPQAKLYDRSCALGPFITLGVSEATVRTWRITLEVRREGGVAFRGETQAGQIKRGFAELAQYLYRSQTLPHGAVLLTGTGVVPPDDFALRPGDVVSIEITGVGRLENPVVEV